MADAMSDGVAPHRQGVEPSVLSEPEACARLFVIGLRSVSPFRVRGPRSAAENARAAGGSVRHASCMRPRASRFDSSSASVTGPGGAFSSRVTVSRSRLELERSTGARTRAGSTGAFAAQSLALASAPIGAAPNPSLQRTRLRSPLNSISLGGQMRQAAVLGSSSVAT